MNNLKSYYTDTVDRAVRTAAQAAVLSVGVETAQANALAFDWMLMGGMAAGGFVLSLLTTVASRGFTGRE